MSELIKLPDNYKSLDGKVFETEAERDYYESIINYKTKCNVKLLDIAITDNLKITHSFEISNGDDIAKLVEYKIIPPPSNASPLPHVSFGDVVIYDNVYLIKRSDNDEYIIITLFDLKIYIIELLFSDPKEFRKSEELKQFFTKICLR